MAEVSMRQMLEAGVHFGHQTHRWNPKMARYIYTARNGIHILDLSQTVRLFRDAFDKVRKVSASGGRVLFVGTKSQASEIVREEALRCGEFFVNYRWLGGTLTNFNTIRRSIERLLDIERKEADGTLDLLTKKERQHYLREKAKLERNLGGIKEMKHQPAAVFIVDPVREAIAVREAHRLGIPVIAIADTNSDPDYIDFPIPGNDDALRSIKLFTSLIADAVAEGKGERSEGKDIPEETPKAVAAPAPVKGPAEVEEEEFTEE
jgi:small subunit ribosomal protein S2